MTQRAQFLLAGTRAILAVLMLAGFVPGSHLVAQQDATIKLLEELTNANAAPGFEGPVRAILKREWQGTLKELRTDGIGNLIGSLTGSGQAPRVLVMAH